MTRGLRRAGLAAAVLGLVVSIYLTVAHFTTPDVLACSESGTIDCSAVTTSAQSSLLGVPVAVLGLIWFAPMIALLSPAAWATGDRRVHLVRTTAAVAGVGFVLWLVFAELFIIRAICLWCTVAHVCAFTIFATTLLAAPGRAPTDRVGQS